ncbi:MAG: hypothetical protein ACOX7X_01540 [Methanosarcina flavescens]|uniref:Uncharacterized protein n=1 Tax=Methanosarcina flavescens TaxID=1715806 RepID=A0A7K4ATJ4_9EURY|nr:hypothetical protein [Methanosarcina flavescens]NLK32021.1 hypothetical protein [Methanosarcina flavescens]
MITQYIVSYPVSLPDLSVLILLGVFVLTLRQVGSLRLLAEGILRS